MDFRRRRVRSEIANKNASLKGQFVMMEELRMRKIAVVGPRRGGKIRPNIDTALAGPKNVDQDLGSPGLVVQYVDGHFVDSYYPTIENTFSKVVRYNGRNFMLEIIGTAGQVCQCLSCPKEKS